MPADRPSTRRPTRRLALAFTGPYVFARIDAGSSAVRIEDRFVREPPC